MASLFDPIPGVFPAKQVHILAGAPGAGKTALMAQMLVDLRDGKAIFGHLPKPVSGIAIAVGDRPWSDHAEWFAAVGWEDIPHYSLVDDAGAPLHRMTAPPGEAPFPLLRRALVALGWIDDPPGPTRILCLDPLALYLGVDPVRDYLKIAQAMVRLSQLCISHNLTILACHHAGKQKVDEGQRYARPQDKILGSAALLGFSGTQMFLSTPSDTGQSHHAFMWCPHHIPEEEFYLVRNKKGLFESLKAGDDLDKPLYDLLAIIPADPTSASILEAAAFDALGFPHATFYRHLRELVTRGLVEQTGRGHYRRATIS